MRRGYEIPWGAAATPIPPTERGLRVAIGTTPARGGTSGRYPSPLLRGDSEPWGGLIEPEDARKEPLISDASIILLALATIAIQRDASNVFYYTRTD